MKDVKFKLQILFRELLFHFFLWKEEVWSIEDLDSLECCNGTDCNCHATTYRQSFEHHYDLRKKP